MTGLIMLVIAYPLSIGPFAWLSDDGILPSHSDHPFNRALALFYEPLNWSLSWDPIREFITWYRALWVG